MCVCVFVYMCVCVFVYLCVWVVGCVGVLLCVCVGEREEREVCDEGGEEGWKRGGRDI